MADRKAASKTASIAPGTPVTRLGAFMAVGLAILAGANPAQAQYFTASGWGRESGNPIAASADFSFSNGVLTIVLSNTSAFDYHSAPKSANALPTDVLTGLFFDISGGFGPSLTFSTATTPAITVGANPANLQLSSTPGGWDFGQSSSGLDGVSEHYGLGTAGFGIFDGGTSAGGLGNPTNFGVMNRLYANGEGNASVNGTPYAQDSVTFKLSVAGAFDPGRIGNVRFQYGTALDEGGLLTLAPEPAAIILVGSAVPTLWLGHRFRRQRLPRVGRPW